MLKNQISLFLATFLIIGLFFLALPEDGYSGVLIPGGPPCCDLPVIDRCVGGEQAALNCQATFCEELGCEFIEDAICVEEDEILTGSCVELQSVSAIPTLSEWGMITIAVVLGIVGIIGFMVIRRRKVNA